MGNHLHIHQSPASDIQPCGNPVHPVCHGISGAVAGLPRSLRLTSARQEGLYAAAGFCGVTMYYLLENIALTYTLASNVGVIISIAPFFTAILGWMFLGGERPRFRFFAGFLLAMAGISLISFGNEAALSLNPTGDLLAVAAAVIWAVYSTLTKKSAHWATALSRVPEGPFFTEFYLWCRLWPSWTFT